MLKPLKCFNEELVELDGEKYQNENPGKAHTRINMAFPLGGYTLTERPWKMVLTVKPVFESSIQTKPKVLKKCLTLHSNPHGLNTSLPRAHWTCFWHLHRCLVNLLESLNSVIFHTVIQ